MGSPIRVPGRGVGQPVEEFGGHVGLLGGAVYLPWLQVRVGEVARAAGLAGEASQGVESKAVPDADEDALTMAVEAARWALAHLPAAGEPPPRVGFLGFASTTLPEPVESRLGLLLEALTLEQEVVTARLYDDSELGGLQALADAARWCAAHPEQLGLVVASQAEAPGELSGDRLALGSGAVALVVSGHAASGPQLGRYAERWSGTLVARGAPRTGADPVRLGIARQVADEEARLVAAVVAAVTGEVPTPAVVVNPRHGRLGTAAPLVAFVEALEAADQPPSPAEAGWRVLSGTAGPTGAAAITFRGGPGATWARLGSAAGPGEMLEPGAYMRLMRRPQQPESR